MIKIFRWVQPLRLDKKTSFKETRNFILLSYEVGLINDDDKFFFFLYLSCISHNLGLIFRTW